MGQIINPSVSTRDIELWYDMRDSISYRGEPTNNLVISDEGHTVNTNYGSTGSIGMQPAPPLREVPHSGVVTTVRFNNTGATRYSCCPSHLSMGNVPIAGNQPYTTSYYMREVTGNARGGNFLYHYQYSTSGYINEFGLFSDSRVRDVENGWKRIWGTFTSASNANNVQLYAFNYVYDTPIEIQMVGYQIENKSYPTPYVTQRNGIRSNTEALLDVSPKKRTITLNSMAYSADNGIRFTAASSNHLTISDPEIGAYNWTIEFVMNTTSTGTTAICVPQSNGIDQAIRYEGSNQSIGILLAVAGDTGERNYFTGAGTVLRNQWYHIVVQRTNNNVFIWINGVKNTFSDTTTNGLWNATWFIGQRGNGTQYFDGEIPIFRVYSRVLTDAEVKGNWDATRGRFGI